MNFGLLMKISDEMNIKKKNNIIPDVTNPGLD